VRPGLRALDVAAEVIALRVGQQRAERGEGQRGERREDRRLARRERGQPVLRRCVGIRGDRVRLDGAVT